MTSFFQVILFSVALLLLERPHFVVIGFFLPLSYQRKQNTPHQLYYSSNVFSNSISTSRSDDDGGGRNSNYDGVEIRKNKNSEKKIEFVNFWGTKWSSDDDNETNAQRQVPFVPTLDVHDGPLPPGAYVMEGKSEFDAKPTCRISIAVKSGNNDIMDDPDEVVRMLQACVDAGFDTFQLHDQTTRSLDIIRRMNENTPSYVNKHWSVSMKAPTIFPDSNTSLKLDIRHSILDLIEQTGGDALDSLQVDCSKLQTSIPSYETTLEMFEHLVDLQREGWIRSIGVKDIESPMLEKEIITYFGDNIDFKQQEGNLLLPPLSSGPCTFKKNIRMADALAGGLLTDLYSNNRISRKLLKHDLQNQLPLLTNNNMHLLNDWATRRKQQHKSTSTSVPVWKLYQEHVVEQMSWIAMKHDVSMSAVALRWALECGSDSGSGTTDSNERSIVSSALADIVFDPKEDVFQKPTELRQVFRFQLDEEDKHILSELSADEQDEEENSEIDFNNPKIWL